MQTVSKTSDFTNYSSNYSRNGFWKALANYAKQLGAHTVWYALVLYYTLESKEVSLRDKFIIVAALGYLIAPADLIPDWVPVIGLTDDAAAIKIAYDTIKAAVTPDIEAKADRKTAQWFGLNAE